MRIASGRGKPFRARVLRLMPILLAAFIFGTLVYKIGPRRLIDVAKRIELGYQPILFCLYFLSQALNAAALHALIRPLDSACRYHRLLSDSLVISSIATATPGRVGEFLMAARLEMYGIPLGKGIAVVLADKAITLSVNLIISAVAAFQLLGIREGIASAALVLLGLGILRAILRSDRIESATERFLSRRPGWRLAGGYAQLRELWRENRNALALNLIITTLRAGLHALFLWTVFRSLGASLDFLLVFMIQAPVQIASLIPLTVSGLGLREGAAVGLFSLANVDPSMSCAAAFIVTVLSHVYSLLVVLVAGAGRGRPSDGEGRSAVRRREKAVAGGW